MITRLGIVAGLVLGMAGCFKPSRMRILDVPQQEFLSAVKSVRAEGDVLKITAIQDDGPVFVADFDSELIDGDVYLKPVYISSVVRKTEFTVNFSGDRYPRDWRNRLYWIEKESISSPVNPTIEHVREIRRSRIEVK